MGQAVAIYCDFIQTGSLTEVNLPAAIKSSLEGIFTVISSTEVSGAAVNSAALAHPLGQVCS